MKQETKTVYLGQYSKIPLRTRNLTVRFQTTIRMKQPICLENILEFVVEENNFMFYSFMYF